MGEVRVIMKFKFREIYRILSLILILTFSFTLLTAGAYSDNSVINEVRQLLKTYYVDKLPDSVLNKSTIDDILKEINKTDTYTTYLTPKKYTNFMNSVNNKYIGIGLYIETVAEGVKVVSVIDGTPEKAAGIMAEDIIMMADNHILVGLTDDKAAEYIKGREGTTVKLRVKRGSDILNVDVIRKQIASSTISGEILDKHIGYIKIISFGEDSASSFAEKIKSFEENKVDSYIIDLRYNGGGLLDAALDIAGYFIGNNVALITKERINGEEKVRGKFHGMLINKPVVFLINKYSASASEVLVAAVKDYKKAYVIGTKSYGKGSVQLIAGLSNNDVLKFTTNKFYSPRSGKAIDQIGITPDLNVTDDIDSMRVAELILDSPNYLKDNRGYVKMTFNNKTVIVNINKMEQSLYWQSYKQLLSIATKNGNVMMGIQNGWNKVSKDYLKNIIKMYYPNYRQTAKLYSININCEFKIDFNLKIMENSITDENIELIDTLTGIRIPVGFRNTKDMEVIVTPKDSLKNGKTYYLVVHPKIMKSNNKPLGYGIINEIITAKKTT